jgi:hypothetical protein
VSIGDAAERRAASTPMMGRLGRVHGTGSGLHRVGGRRRARFGHDLLDRQIVPGRLATPGGVESGQEFGVEVARREAEARAMVTANDVADIGRPG